MICFFSSNSSISLNSSCKVTNKDQMGYYHLPEKGKHLGKKNMYIGKKICTSARKYVHRLIINKLQGQENHILFSSRYSEGDLPYLALKARLRDVALA